MWLLWRNNERHSGRDQKWRPIVGGIIEKVAVMHSDNGPHARLCPVFPFQRQRQAVLVKNRSRSIGCRGAKGVKAYLWDRRGIGG